MRANNGEPRLRSVRILVPVLALVLATAAASPTFRYQLDGTQSEVNARVAFMGLASKTAHFPRMSGAIRLTPGRLDTIDMDVELDARALTAGDKSTTETLKGKDFFDVVNHPVVRFEGQRMTMTGPVTARLDGQITARGVTRPATLTITFRQDPAKATGRDPILLSARTTINRQDFGMKAYSLVVGKKVTITINARMVPG